MVKGLEMRILCFNICCSCVTHLLRNLSGSSPFTVDSSGFTPLHYAASSGHKMAIQMVSTITEGVCPKGCGMRSPWSFLAFGLCTRRHLGYSCRRYQDHAPSSCCEFVCACVHTCGGDYCVCRRFMDILVSWRNCCTSTRFILM